MTINVAIYGNFATVLIALAIYGALLYMVSNQEAHKRIYRNILMPYSNGIKALVIGFIFHEIRTISFW